MGFVDLTPVRRANGTGVRISRSDRNGIILSISGAARAALGLAPDARLRVQHDADPALPRLRIIVGGDGLFHATLPVGRGKKGDGDNVALMIRLGHIPALAGPSAKSLDCTWEENGPGTIDVDLPREMRGASTSVAIPAANGRTNTVTLPGRVPVKERA